jgi:hypothetical protein
MALTQSLELFDPGPHRAQPSSRNKVIPFPSPRVLLPVTLLRESADRSRAQLWALLHSPLGVYVASTEVVRDEIRVQLNIAPDDLDFTMHTLIATLPQAMIGPVKRRNVSNEAR